MERNFTLVIFQKKNCSYKVFILILILIVFVLFDMDFYYFNTYRYRFVAESKEIAMTWITFLSSSRRLFVADPSQM